MNIILLVVSTSLMGIGILYGFKIMKLVRLNKLWTTAWAAFIATLLTILIRRFSVYVIGVDGHIEQVIVVVASFSFLLFAYLIHRFFKKYMIEIKKE